MGGQSHPKPNTDPKPKHTKGFDFNGKGSGRHFATREGVTADERWGCGKTPVAGSASGRAGTHQAPQQEG